MVIREIDVDWLDSGADFPGLETWTPALHRAGSVKGWSGHRPYGWRRGPARRRCGGRS